MPLEIYHVRAVHPGGSGPWSDEPDKISWIDPATDLPCIMRRGNDGALRGYVGVGTDHPLFGMTAEALPHEPALIVHGGIDYAEPCKEWDAPEISVCHVPDARRNAPLAAPFDAAARRETIGRHDDL